MRPRFRRLARRSAEYTTTTTAIDKYPLEPSLRRFIPDARPVMLLRVYPLVVRFSHSGHERRIFVALYAPALPALLIINPSAAVRFLFRVVSVSSAGALFSPTTSDPRRLITGAAHKHLAVNDKSSLFVRRTLFPRTCFVLRNHCFAALYIYFIRCPRTTAVLSVRYMLCDASCAHTQMCIIYAYRNFYRPFSCGRNKILRVLSYTVAAAYYCFASPHCVISPTRARKQHCSVETKSTSITIGANNRTLFIINIVFIGAEYNIPNIHETTSKRMRGSPARCFTCDSRR